jgi:hypothetical protein
METLAFMVLVIVGVMVLFGKKQPGVTREEQAVFSDANRTAHSTGEGCLAGVIAVLVGMMVLFAVIPDPERVVNNNLDDFIAGQAQFQATTRARTAQIRAHTESLELTNPQCFQWYGAGTPDSPRVCVNWERMADGALPPQP